MSYQKIGRDGHPLGEPALAAFFDPKTGLMWPAQDVSTSSMNFEEAKRACSNFRCAGFDDWRLPTRAELETLLDLSRHNPAADPELALKSEYYWSSTPVASSPGGYAWGVSFSLGHVYWANQYSTAFVRAVRGPRASQ